MLIALALLSTTASLAIALSGPSMAVLVLASGIGGIGRGGGAGSGGNWGPMMPAEQPLVVAAARQNSTKAFGVLSFVGVLASAAGSLVAGAPSLLLARGLPLGDGYRLLFGLGAALMCAAALVALPLREAPAARAEEPLAPAAFSLGQLLGRLGLTNALSGFGFGFLGPLLTYWFYRRYGVDAAGLAVLYAIVNLVSALPYLAAATLSRRIGQVRIVVLTRLAAVAALLAMPFMPSLGWAGAAYALRMAVNSLGMPARQSFTMGAVAERQRSRVAAFGALPSQITSMVSPAIGGALMEEILNVPLFGAAVFMFLSAVTYHLAFHKAERAGEDSLR